MTTEQADGYYDLYANQAAPADLLRLGEDIIAEQIAELNADENEWEAAEGILQVAREAVISQARTRIEDNEVFALYSELFFADWPEGDEHLVWLVTAPVTELTNWAEGIRQQETDNAMDSITKYMR